ncbi:kinase domain-containing [Lecanosticta acicola]|uniref:mitogen-activated protein kinase kinase n=1 Tax=Lecanosticta acicola TaxID=111012 RepID=A0AAI8Z4Y3_9PEZI|nr:kinase domain-containing [Lecanosticta acicola]
MAAHFAWLQCPSGEHDARDSAHPKQRSRPLPLRMRTYSVTGLWSPGFDEKRDGVHARNKSLSVAHDVSDFSPTGLGRISDDEDGHVSSDDDDEEDTGRTSLEETSVSNFADISGMSLSPDTPLTSIASERSSLDCDDGPNVLAYDFSRIDYELERAKVLGTGLWSTVYLAEQKRTQAPRLSASLSPKKSPRWSRKSRSSSAPTLFAVKVPSRQDAKEIFDQEARVLTHLLRRPTATQHIVSFYGLDPRNGALVSEAVIGGSLENLNGRLKVMTEVARHLELVNIFPGIAYDLISGLTFLHHEGVVHADIKPGNVLLDVSEHATQQQPVIRARFIDFSAAFIPSRGDSASNAGGTWDYMAPEQMRIQKDLSTPTFASDVWSLGISLLYILVGDSPYSAACAGNVFMLREAIKTGDPLQFARMDPVARKRLAACQDFVDICRQALKKDREIRTSASAWLAFLEDFGA